MYTGVPMAKPTEVMPLSPAGPADSDIALATPKSVTTACPAVTRTLSGLMSRWMTPCSCAYTSASATSRRSRRASSTGSSPDFSSRARSESPSMSGIV